MELIESDNLEPDSLYRIDVQGDLNESWSAWLGEGNFKRISHELSSGQTVIFCDVPDQAALRGLMNKLWDLNLTIVSVKVQKYKSDGEKNEC